MLHTKTIEPGTLSLLKHLMGLSFLKPFTLVGGTALSLRYGHRSSVDLDLFFHEKFNFDSIVNGLETEFHERFDYRKQQAKFGIFCYIDQIKVDIVYYPHIPLSDIIIEDNIRFYSDADIAAMKIQAVLGRGKKKDFWDLYELFQHYSLEQIIAWHEQKFPSQMLAISIPNALTYFDEADESEDPVSFKNQSWEKVKSGVKKAVREYLK